MSKARGPAATRERTNALHALHEAGLLKFIRSEASEGGRKYRVNVKGKEMELVGAEVDTFVKTLVTASGRDDIDLANPFRASA